MENTENVRTDETLCALAKAGDGQAMEELMLRYANTVRRLARRFFLVGGETEDLIQEGMMGVYRAIGSFHENGAEKWTFKGFATMCVQRRIIDAVKRSARQKNVPLNNYVSIFDGDWVLPELSPEERVIQMEDRTEFLQKMSRSLSDFEFRVTVMYMDGLSMAEICVATGKNEKSVDNAIQRSKRKLQKLMTK